MKLLNGKIISDIIKDDLKQTVGELFRKTGRKPKLTVIQVGNDTASTVYVKNKIKSCEYIGIDHDLIHLPEGVTQGELISQIRSLNESPSVTGILVQLPLPGHINEYKVMAAIAPCKDVDGFHEINVGRLMLGNSIAAPCTPAGIMKILDYYNIDVSGRECVVVGRSNIVGKPMAMLLLHNNGTVTVCHSKTQNLTEVCRRADILVCAVGKPKFFTREYIKPGAVVIDVGIHRQESGKLCGDVDFEDVKDVVSAITPVPGGVGAMTVAMLMENCVKLSLFILLKEEEKKYD